MAQSLLLGLGGTGSRIVNYVAAELKKNQKKVNDGNICCAVLDTDGNDRDLLIKDDNGIPVIATSRAMTIDSYMRHYANKGVRQWMPTSPEVLKQNMTDGASQMRPKSRLAMLDTTESVNDNILRLERVINTMFNDRDDSKIRIMIVSSLAGGTGSGMFIQTALWLRKYFEEKNCSVIIRGIFVLPDVFIRTVDNIRNSTAQSMSLYANAYAAIRELNTISKIKAKGYSPLRRVKLDSLFDSNKDIKEGNPVYDFAFFVDDVTESGATLESLAEYEKIVSQMVYMQLYAPMEDELYSVEDNMFKCFELSSVENDEPIYGACGSAKAIYPKHDILRYCALKATKESISKGWSKIDAEIEQKKIKERDAERSGKRSAKRVDTRKMFVNIFDRNIGKTEDEVGKDRLFTLLAREVVNTEWIQQNDGMAIPNDTDKVEDYLKKLEEFIEIEIDATISAKKITVNKGWAEDGEATISELKDYVNIKARAVDSYIMNAEDNCDTMVENLLEKVCSTDIGNIKADNNKSIYGALFTKINEDNKILFIHPLSVRYLIYKLVDELDARKKVDLDKARRYAKKGSDEGNRKFDWDNPKTSGDSEEDAIQYLDSNKKKKKEKNFCKEFREKYASFNKGQVELCRKYAILSLREKFYNELKGKLVELVEIFEEFFEKIPKVTESINEAIAKNIEKNERIGDKVIYVCADEKEKKALYDSLAFDCFEGNESINKIIIDAAYGKFCYQDSPLLPNNEKYKSSRIDAIFRKEAVAAYSKLIVERNKEDVDLDIYDAICKEAEFNGWTSNDSAEIDEDNVDYFEEATEEETDSESGKTIISGNLSAVEKVARSLKNLASPFLLSGEDHPPLVNEGDDLTAEPELEGNIYVGKKQSITFWGYHPVLAKKCPQIAGLIGTNVSKQANDAYDKCELHCYRGVYGIVAGKVRKFNELTGGKYFTNYRQIIDKMTEGVSKGDDDILVITPHLDKTWHEFMPYITEEKEKQDNIALYRLFWLGFAYGLLRLSKEDRYEVLRTRITDTGSVQMYEPVKFEGRYLSKDEVDKLIAALKVDGAFKKDATYLERKFEKEYEASTNYVTTGFFKGKPSGKKAIVGGVASETDSNAVNVLVRYFKSPRHNEDVACNLVNTLETLLRELVSHVNYGGQANDERVIKEAYDLCKIIYKNSTLAESYKDSPYFRTWYEAWGDAGDDEEKASKKKPAKKSTAKKPAAKAKKTAKKTTKK